MCQCSKGVKCSLVSSTIFKISCSVSHVPSSTLISKGGVEQSMYVWKYHGFSLQTLVQRLPMVGVIHRVLQKWKMTHLCLRNKKYYSKSIYELLFVWKYTITYCSHIVNIRFFFLFFFITRMSRSPHFICLVLLFPGQYKRIKYWNNEIELLLWINQFSVFKVLFVLGIYTTNPHECSASNGRASCLPSTRRATTERLASGHWAISLGSHSVSTRQALGRQPARPLLAKRSRELVLYIKYSIHNWLAGPKKRGLLKDSKGMHMLIAVCWKYICGQFFESQHF